MARKVGRRRRRRRRAKNERASGRAGMKRAAERRECGERGLRASEGQRGRGDGMLPGRAGVTLRRPFAAPPPLTPSDGRA